MAEDITGSINSGFVVIERVHTRYLAHIRAWTNLQVASENDHLWIKNFTAEQWTDIALKQIPFIHKYIVKDQLLFVEGSLLPSRKMPSLLWSPIAKVLPVSLPELNHHFFGLQDTLPVVLKPSDQQRETFAMLINSNDLLNYANQAPEVRLQPLSWCMFNDSALIIGYPPLPINGKSYWLCENALLPAGYEYEFPILAGSIEQKLNNRGDHYILWSPDNTTVLIPKQHFTRLSRSGIRLNIHAA